MKNKLLIYDDNCPLCTWYSGLFVRHGFLSPSGRVPFTMMDERLKEQIDMRRAVNEIALADKDGGQTLYGVDSLLAVLGSRWGWMERVGRTKLVRWVANKLYKLVSYNRKVIVAKKCSAERDCVPEMNYRYRFLFMLICLAFNTAMLYPLHEGVFSGLPYYHLTITELQLGHFALVASNCLLSLYFRKQKRFDYLGQVNMLALQVILCLTTLYIMNRLFAPNALFETVWMAGTAVFIFREYIRRMDYAGILLKHHWVVSANLACLTGFVLFLFRI